MGREKAILKSEPEDLPFYSTCNLLREITHCNRRNMDWFSFVVSFVMIVCYKGHFLLPKQ